MIEKLREWIASPLGKTMIFIDAVILSGIFCGTFVTEITVEGALVWSGFYKTVSFYLIIGYCVILYLYNKFIYIQEKNMMNFLDEDYCKAYIRSKSLPIMMEKFEDIIRSGQNSSELVEIQNQLEEFIK